MRRLLRNPANETPPPAEAPPPAVRPYIPCTGAILQGVAVEPTMESYGWNIKIKNCTWPHLGSEFEHLGTPIGDLAQFAMYGPVTPQPPHRHLRGLRDLSSARRLQLLSHGIRVLHDIDDTIVCSGGSHFKGIDKKCAGTKEKHLYPGVVELFYALSVGPSAAAVWGEAAASYTVPFSARPGVLYYLLAARQCSGEDLRFRRKICGCAGGKAGCKRGDADCGCFGIDTELAQYGRIRDCTDFVNQRFKRLGRTKFGNWYSNVYGRLGQPAVFFGDNGQGDLVAAQLMLLTSQKLSPQRGAVLAAFIHDVQEPPACPSVSCRSAWARHNIFFFRDYAEATAIALDLGLISSRFAARILWTDATGPSLANLTEPAPMSIVVGQARIARAPPGLEHLRPVGCCVRPGVGFPPGLPPPDRAPELPAGEDWSISDRAAAKPGGVATEDNDSDCSTVDTADAAEEVPRPYVTKLEDVGYSAGKVLQEEVAHASGAQRASGSSVTPSQDTGLGCPSVGSVGHHLGLCTPCDFVFRGGCRVGPACKFCHLCDFEDNKRRKQDKRKFIRSLKARGIDPCACLPRQPPF